MEDKKTKKILDDLTKRFYKPKFLENFHFSKCINLISYLMFTLVAVVLVKAIINQFIPTRPTSPTDLRFMLISYSGLPFAFWFFISLGLALGLTFHGFNLFSIYNKK